MSKRTWITTAALLAAVVIALVIVVAVVNRSQGDTQTEQTPAGPEPTELAPEPSAGESGTVETDLSGRQVVVPTNPAGDILSDSTDGGGSCEDLRSPAGIQIQRINMYPLLLSTDSGPTQTDGAVPTGYADGPRGALLAGTNYLWLLQSGGTPSKEVARDHVVADEEFQRIMEAEVEDGFNSERNNLGAPVSFKVRSCSQDAVVIDYAYDLFGDANGPFPKPKWAVQSVLVVKDSGQWKLSMREGSYTDRGIADDREGFTTWDM